MIAFTTELYLIVVKSGITCVISHNYAKIKVDLYDPLAVEKTLTVHNVIIHIKLVWNKDQNYYSYNIFLEKCPYQLSENNYMLYITICYIMIELTFLKELMLIRKANQKNAIFVSTGIFG